MHKWKIQLLERGNSSKLYFQPEKNQGRREYCLAGWKQREGFGDHEFTLVHACKSRLRLIGGRKVIIDTKLIYQRKYLPLHL